MPILVNRFQINDPMPTLGQLVREAIQPEPCKFRAFEAAPHRHDIKEHECRQIKSYEATTCKASGDKHVAPGVASPIKGAAQGSNAEKVGTARPSPVAAPPSAWRDSIMIQHDHFAYVDTHEDCETRHSRHRRELNDTTRAFSRTLQQAFPKSEGYADTLHCVHKPLFKVTKSVRITLALLVLVGVALAAWGR